LLAAGAQTRPGPDGAAEVAGLDARAIGEIAAAAGIALHELTPERASLEEAFVKLTQGSVEFGSTAVAS
jgi:ABC-2 type transport system ATP-binding protein